LQGELGAGGTCIAPPSPGGIVDKGDLRPPRGIGREAEGRRSPRGITRRQKTESPQGGSKRDRKLKKKGSGFVFSLLSPALGDPAVHKI